MNAKLNNKEQSRREDRITYRQPLSAGYQADLLNQPKPGGIRKDQIRCKDSTKNMCPALPLCRFACAKIIILWLLDRGRCGIWRRPFLFGVFWTEQAVRVLFGDARGRMNMTSEMFAQEQEGGEISNQKGQGKRREPYGAGMGRLWYLPRSSLQFPDFDTSHRSTSPGLQHQEMHRKNLNKE